MRNYLKLFAFNKLVPLFGGDDKLSLVEHFSSKHLDSSKLIKREEIQGLVRRLSLLDPEAV